MLIWAMTLAADSADFWHYTVDFTMLRRWGYSRAAVILFGRRQLRRCLYLAFWRLRIPAAHA